MSAEEHASKKAEREEQRMQLLQIQEELREARENRYLKMKAEEDQGSR